MKAVRINISQASPGMTAAEDIFNAGGQMIIPRGATLTEKAITRLSFHSVSSFRIYIDDSEPDLLAAGPPEQEEKSYFEKLRKTPEFTNFNKSFEDTVSKFEDRFKAYLDESAQTETSELLNSVKSLLGSCDTGIQVFDLLHCMRGYDDLTYVHSVNVAMICAVMGTWLGFNKVDIDVLILCGALHDIGKLTIPRGIITKPGKLNDDEYSLVKSHAMRGYGILCNRTLNKHIKLAAMMHHERCDGSGYPFGLRDGQIDEYAKIVAIADVYDAMTSTRVYRSAISPFTVIHIFETEGLAAYDTRFVMTFIEHISQSYLGTKVLLSNGMTGTIVYINRNAYSRPMVQTDDKYIDLLKEPNLDIDQIL